MNPLRIMNKINDMNIKIILILLIIPFFCYPQYKDVESYSVNGYHFKVGEEIRIGKPSGDNQEYVSLTTKGTLGSPPIRIRSSLNGGVFKVHKIRVLKKEAGGIDGANIIFKIRKAKFMISIRQGIYLKELII